MSSYESSLFILSGEMNGAQLRFLGSAIRPYGKEGCADITTRANIQLRGVTIEDADKVSQEGHGGGQRQLAAVCAHTVKLGMGTPYAGRPHAVKDSRSC
jgi:ferredoxin-nitrite reductase